MAKIGEIKKTNVKQSMDIEPTIESNEESTIVQPDISAIIERLNKLEAENKEFRKTQWNVFKDAKEKYKWPWAYSYKMWWWVPVLSYVSYKKDKTKDFEYKNEYWVMTHNHYLKLSLADETTIDVESNEFNQHATKSDKIICEIIWNENNPEGFKFKHDEYWEFVVAINSIN